MRNVAAWPFQSPSFTQRRTTLVIGERVAVILAAPDRQPDFASAIGHSQTSPLVLVSVAAGTAIVTFPSAIDIDTGSVNGSAVRRVSFIAFSIGRLSLPSTARYR